MKRNKWHQIQGILVEAGHTDLAEAIAEDLNVKDHAILDDADKSAGRNQKKSSGGKLEKEVTKKQASNNSKTKVKNGKTMNKLEKEFNANKQKAPVRKS